MVQKNSFMDQEVSPEPPSACTARSEWVEFQFQSRYPFKAVSDKLTQEPHPSRPPSPPPPPPHSQGLSVSAQADRLGVSAGHTPQLCTWNCSHSRLAVNPHTCSHLRPAASPFATSSPAFVSSIISQGRQKAKKKKVV